MSELSFRIKAMTGDLLLFRSKHLLSKVQRKLTNSEYDHVGIVIRMNGDPSEVFFLEAVSSGVRLNRWSQVRELLAHPRNPPATQMYTKAAFRHVNIPRSSWLHARMQEFMAETLGKDYELSHKKLLRLSSTHRTPSLDLNQSEKAATSDAGTTAILSPANQYGSS